MMNKAEENTGSDTGLVVELTLPKRPVRFGEEIPAQVRLVNHGRQATRVNSRLGMAYPDTDDRELYCLIRNEAGDEYTDYRRFQMDYRRKPLEEDHFPYLKPGESLKVTFNLQEWYRLTRPGIYQVQVVYHPEEHELLSDSELHPVTSAPVSILLAK